MLIFTHPPLLQDDQTARLLGSIANLCILSRYAEVSSSRSPSVMIWLWCGSGYQTHYFAFGEALGDIAAIRFLECDRRHAVDASCVE